MAMKDVTPIPSPIPNLHRPKLHSSLREKPKDDKLSHDAPVSDFDFNSTQTDLLARLQIIEQLQETSSYSRSALGRYTKQSFQDSNVLKDILRWITCYLTPYPSSHSNCVPSPTGQPSPINPKGNGVAVSMAVDPGRITLYIAHDEYSAAEAERRLKLPMRLFLSVLKDVLDSWAPRSRSPNPSKPSDTHSPSTQPQNQFQLSPIAPSTSTRLFFRLTIDATHGRITSKLKKVVNSAGSPGETIERFSNLVEDWLVYRPEGERSQGFNGMVQTYGGSRLQRLRGTRPYSPASDETVDSSGDEGGPGYPSSRKLSPATAYFLQTFFSIVSSQHRIEVNGKSAFSNPEERFACLSSLITACALLVNSTFFNDLVGTTDRGQTWRMTLKMQDRLFLLTLFNRLSTLAAYKSGAAKWAYMGIPWVKDVLSQYHETQRTPGNVPSDIKTRLRGTSTHGPGIHIVFVTPLLRVKELKIKLHREMTFPASSQQMMARMLGVSSLLTEKVLTEVENGQVQVQGGGTNENNGNNYHHRGPSVESQASFASALSAYTTASESSNATCTTCTSSSSDDPYATLCNHLRAEVVLSEIVSQSWRKGDKTLTQLHPEMQLITFLEMMNIPVCVVPGGFSSEGDDDDDDDMEYPDWRESWQNRGGELIATSKPSCWMCTKWVRALGKRDRDAGRATGRDVDEEDGMDEDRVSVGDGNKWRRKKEDVLVRVRGRRWHLTGSAGSVNFSGNGKLKGGWQVPPLAHSLWSAQTAAERYQSWVNTVKAVDEDAQNELERVVDEVAGEWYL
ncbi:hypothetical protein D9758_014219 [Tetrapyrgos nigripes]|uniref:Uncharacterized protein n=1 Tax=Tetrapyrgos nigripes TaxID=182062 RepID=A0A8H5FTY6_9AGAR|nr:hypothetical protein D9758_014219 [Tetrapyrgos nigripes]